MTYTYDELDRLTSETIECNGTTSITRYTYDSNSNRLSMDKDGEVTIYVYNELNQLVQAGDVIYTYDDAGNLVAQSENGVLIATYEYNARNQMIHAQVIQATGMVEESYTYNYLGDRTSKTSNGVTTYYTLDYSTGLSQNIVIEHEGQTTFYVRGFELISGTTEEMGLEETFFYLYDGGNSVRAIADGNGAITDEYIFDAFGNKIAHEGESENEYGFQGEQQDETGLYYLRARYMDPVTGTFTSMDTYGGSLSDPVSLHKYLFANSNPVKYCDPSGHLSLQEMGVNMLIWGIISSVLYVGAATLNDLCRPNSDVTSQFSVSGFIKYVITGVFTGGIVGSLTGAAFLYLASAGTAGLVIAIYFYFLFALVCFVISTCACQDDYNSSLWFGIGMGFVPLPGKYTGDISGIVADVLQWITEAL